MRVRNLTGRRVWVDDLVVLPGLDFAEVKDTRHAKALVKAGVLEAAPFAEPNAQQAREESKERSK